MLETVMIPFVVSLAPSVAILDGHGFVLDAVVEKVTALQRVDATPEILSPVILAAPLSESVIVP